MKISARNADVEGCISLGKFTSDRHLVLPVNLDRQLAVDILHVTPSMRRRGVHAYLLTTAGLERVLSYGERPSFPPSSAPLLMDRMLIDLAITSGDTTARPVDRNRLRLPRQNFGWKPGPLWFLSLDDYVVVSDDRNVFAAYVAAPWARTIQSTLGRPSRKSR